jgi:hypothetical protein
VHEGTRLTFTIAGSRIAYAATVNRDAPIFIGTITQSIPLPLNLTHAAAETAKKPQRTR